VRWVAKTDERLDGAHAPRRRAFHDQGTVRRGCVPRRRLAGAWESRQQLANFVDRRDVGVFATAADHIGAHIPWFPAQ
jgi:hypothetical protein